MAGTSPDFDPDQFRADIRAAMLMGQALDAAQRPTFRWKPVRTFASSDRAGQPWDPNTTATTTTDRDDVQVLCAVEEVGGQTSAGDELSIGTVDRDRLVIVLLDEEYAEVADFELVDIGGDTYTRSKELAPIALHDVGVHRVVVQADDET